MIFASSVSVYPFDEQQQRQQQGRLGPANTGFREEDSERKVNPEGGYGWSKYIAEKQLSLMPDINSGVARIFHAYGENIYLRPDRSQVIGSLIRKAITVSRRRGSSSGVTVHRGAVSYSSTTPSTPSCV